MEINEYNQQQDTLRRQICEELRNIIETTLPKAESKIWHGAPVWFLDGNPIVGYDNLKDGVRLLFWSGQSFDEKGLRPEGKFKAAEARYSDSRQIDKVVVRNWLRKAQDIQWDYKNIVKRKGVLERIK